ncbi:DUF3823 domain-containing protein [Mucilaginibacter pedocola]|uniref:DUF3823 domain-containing protein n=1 Tax=Mucilaginibacter pedocola TaxID=1792845 RepID=A0A1S9P9R7_9SPHI|nr:DUF3823 domain-containing protein [Mucilaginibacter pedocola]OOQ57328.1 hypothetical protein BC343_14565 [Mucilaginibacter pedocola]
MKIKFHYIIIALLFAATGCKKDNYEAPNVTLSGHLVYQGENVNVEFGRVPFLLFQSGFQLNKPIEGNFDQDGKYSVKTFAGNYKLTMSANQGPFLWKELGSGKRDTVAINLTGDQTVDLEVTPFYMVRQPVFTAAAGRKINATFNLEKVITDANAKNIERVYLYMSKTQFVSSAYSLPAPDGTPIVTSIAGSALTSLNNISMSITAPELVPAQNYYFVRIGVKIDGVEDMIFSPVAKVTVQ